MRFFITQPTVIIARHHASHVVPFSLLLLITITFFPQILRSQKRKEKRNLLLNLFGLLCSLLVERYSASSSQRPYPPYIRTIIGGLSYRLVPADSPNIHHHLPLFHTLSSPPLGPQVLLPLPLPLSFSFFTLLSPPRYSCTFLYGIRIFFLACRFLSSPLLLLSLSSFSFSLPLSLCSRPHSPTAASHMISE